MKSGADVSSGKNFKNFYIYFYCSSWDYLTHYDATKQAYHWGEDGLLGVSDKFGMLCASLALWNHKDPILKERLFGLTGKEVRSFF